MNFEFKFLDISRDCPMHVYLIICAYIRTNLPSMLCNVFHVQDHQTNQISVTTTLVCTETNVFFCVCENTCSTGFASLPVQAEGNCNWRGMRDAVKREPAVLGWSPSHCSDGDPSPFSIFDPCDRLAVATCSGRKNHIQLLVFELFAQRRKRYRQDGGIAKTPS